MHDPILKFSWHWENTLIAGQKRPLAVASDPDAMLIQACERQDAGEEGVVDPFWATTWRAASGLDLYLERLPIQGKNVLEVGCGTGHAGIAAALRGAHVMLTDGVEDPLDLVRLSITRLGIQAEVRVLRLGMDDLPGRSFPYILGSDVTYLRTLWPQLLQTADRLLEPDGTLLLSDPHRFIADEFLEWLRGQPWKCDTCDVYPDEDRDHPIRVMTLRRQSGRSERQI